ncbi:MAG: alpha/beta hydrolase [Cyanobium sp. CACIAM 14]|nr:MAG: alpha/beta hydrolase [Cyanobium sp. CACIAM 14]
MVRVQDAWLNCPDGVRLAARLWRPEGEGPWPVLVMRQPYGRAIASTVTYAHPSWYAERGFLVVVQDVRGRGDSEGDFGGFGQEAADGAATIRWARGLEGSNGWVGTYGFSYQGLTQLLNDGGGSGDAAALPDCLAPAMCGLDERLHWASEGGAHWWALGLAWALQLAAEGCRRRGETEAWREIRRSLQSGRFLEEGPALLERHDPDGMGLRWLTQDPAAADGWTTHSVTPELLRRPMLLIGGWHDPHLGGVLDLWRRARAAGGRPGLLIGAWTHLDWQGGVDAELLAFFRRHLQVPPPASFPAGPPEPLRLQCALSGSWLELEGPEHLERSSPALAWSLHSGGLAAIRSDEGELRPSAPADDLPPAAWEPTGPSTVVLVHDPWRAVPGRGGHLGLDAGPADRGDLDRRADVACFSTAPLEDPLLLLGSLRLRLRISADQPSFDLCAALSVLETHGRTVHQLCTGVARFGPRPAGRGNWRSLRFQPVCAQLEPGQRLRLSLAAAAWPQIAVNPGDGRRPMGGSGPDHRVISLTLELEGSRLSLDPLLPASP